MTRVFAKTTAEKLILTQTRAAQIVDAVAGLLMALLVSPFLLGGVALASARHWSFLGLLLLAVLCAPSTYFLILAVNSIVRIFFPRRIIIDRSADSIALNGKAIGRIEDLREMKIVFTGFYSPSRNTLRATMASGKTYCVEATGYSGSRLELRQLCDLIAEFTQRFDLYAR